MKTNIIYKFPVKHIQLKSHIDLAYIDEGKGDQTIIFIHGLANYANVFSSQVRALQTNFRCISIDLPGCGYSSKGNYSYSMDFFAQTISDFCEALNLKKVILCGHSMGGQIAMKTAIEFPSLIQKLVLLAPAGFEKFSQNEVYAIEHLMAFGGMFINNESQLAGYIKQSFYKYSDEDSRMLEDLFQLLQKDKPERWRKMVTACIHAMLDEQMFDELKKVSCPVLAVFGEKDIMIPNVLMHPYTTKHVAQEAIQQFKNGSLRMIPFAGHFVFFEKPHEVNKCILEFAETATSKH